MILGDADHSPVKGYVEGMDGVADYTGENRYVRETIYNTDE